MAWTDTNPVAIGGDTEKAHFDAVFDNSKWLRNSVGDFTLLSFGTAVNGSAASPLLTWRDDLDTGLYRIGSGNIAFACNGAKILDILTSGIGVTGAISLSGAITGATAITASGVITGASLVLSGAISGATSIACTSITGLSGLAIGGALSTVSSLSMTGVISGATTIGCSGNITSSGGALSVAGEVSGASLLLTGASITVGGVITGASLVLGGSITGVTTITASGAATVEKVVLPLTAVTGTAGKGTLTGFFTPLASAIGSGLWLKVWYGTTAKYIALYDGTE